jgi:hypothetical protein
MAVRSLPGLPVSVELQPHWLTYLFPYTQAALTLPPRAVDGTVQLAITQPGASYVHEWR